MEKETASRLVLDGLEKGFLTIKWATGRKTKFSYQNLIKKGEKLGYLIEVCSGCGKPTSGRDCGCPAGTSLIWK
jgi:hypothetical protein